MQRGSDALTREPNVIPMIDILLVLLIVFILDAIHGQKKLELQLPVPTEDAVSAVPPIVLDIGPGPSYRLNQQVVPAAQLGAQLTAVFAGRPTKVLFVKGDPTVRYQDIVTAFDIARGAGVRVSGVMLPGSR